MGVIVPQKTSNSQAANAQAQANKGAAAAAGGLAQLATVVADNADALQKALLDLEQIKLAIADLQERQRQA